MTGPAARAAGLGRRGDNRRTGDGRAGPVELRRDLASWPLRPAWTYSSGPATSPAAVQAVTEAVGSGRISQARLDESVLRVLTLKLQYLGQF